MAGQSSKLRKNSSDAELIAHVVQRRRSISLQDIAARQKIRKSSSSSMFYTPIHFHPPSAPVQFLLATLASIGIARRLRGWMRVLSLGGLWAAVEALRLLWFRRLITFVSNAALRTPLARQGVKPLGRITSESQLDEIGGYSLAQMSLCQHLLAALRKGHRFDGHARAHLLRNGLPDNTQGWFALLHTILSNNGTLGMSSIARMELQKLCAACSNCQIGKPLESVSPLWGLAGQNCAWPRPLFLDAALDSFRKVQELDLFALRGYKQRRIFVKIVNAEVEYLLWTHSGPRESSHPPLLFMHGVGSGAAMYGPVLSHFAKSRSVIAVEVPGVSKAQEKEVGPAAILDGLASVVTIALGSHKVYDVVSHSGGGWWTSVLLRAAARGQLEAPRRVVMMQSPCVVPAFLGIYLQGQGHYLERFPVPYVDRGGMKGALCRFAGLLVFALFGKDIWNIHLMFTCFAADELVVLPETLHQLADTSVCFIFGEEDCFIDAHACTAYIHDMLPRAQALVVPGAGHGTFMKVASEWAPTMAPVDRFLYEGILQ